MLKKLREMVDGDVDVAIEASGAEYGKSTMKKTELATELQLDTADISDRKSTRLNSSHWE